MKPIMLMDETIRLALSESRMVNIHGKAAPGVYAACKDVLDRAKPKPLFLVMDSKSTRRTFLLFLAEALGIHIQKATMLEVESLVLTKLQVEPRSIFIDMAQNLSPANVHTVCLLWDKARVPVILLSAESAADTFTVSRFGPMSGHLLSRISHYAAA